jgi:polysaccharide biosynthesis/export protein
MHSKLTNALARLSALCLLLGAFTTGHAQDSDLLTLEADVVTRYLIGPDDVLHIAVWKETELQRQVIVRPDGRISFPLIGEIPAAARTPGELQQEITQRLRRFIPDPVVTVIVEKVASYKIYVIGEVRNAGQFQLGHYIDVVQALALAGGLTPFAAENRIQILRRENGMETAIPFRYSQIKAGRDLDQNIILKRGDVILVP